MPAADPAAVAEALRQLEGTWVYESQTLEGTRLPDERMAGHRIVIEGDTMTQFAPSIRPMKSILKVNPTTKPKMLDSTLLLLGTTHAGIYELEGDTLTWCFDNTGKSRPAEFASEPGTGLILSVLKRQR